jgi:hypothetical protein
MTISDITIRSSISVKPRAAAFFSAEPAEGAEPDLGTGDEGSERPDALQALADRPTAARSR